MKVTEKNSTTDKWWQPSLGSWKMSAFVETDLTGRGSRNLSQIQGTPGESKYHLKTFRKELK
jgi:hypothetical protein